MQHREHEPQVDRDRRLPREQRLDALLEREVAGIDVVVEGDHLVRELGIVLAKRVDRPAHGAQDEVTFFEQRRLQSVHLFLQRHTHVPEPTRIGRSRSPRFVDRTAA